jgi:hypothetical protein
MDATAAPIDHACVFGRAASTSVSVIFLREVVSKGFSMRRLRGTCD